VREKSENIKEQKAFKRDYKWQRLSDHIHCKFCRECQLVRFMRQVYA